MPLPPSELKRKRDVIAWMKKRNWKHGDNPVVQHLVIVDINRSKIAMMECTYIPNRFKCPRASHARSEWIFLTLLPTGVYLACAHPKCRITYKLNEKGTLVKRKPLVEITYKEAREWFAKERQEKLDLTLDEFASRHPEYEFVDDDY